MSFSFFSNHKKKLNMYTARKNAAAFTIGLFKLLFILGLAYLFLFPLFYMVSVAFQDPESVLDPTIVYVPKKFTLKSITAAAETLDYGRSLGLTLIISVFSTLASLAACSMAGYALARCRFPGKKISMLFVVLLIIIPQQTLLLSSYLNFRFFDFGGILKLLSPITGVSHINLLNTPFTFILPSLFGVGLRSGLFIFIFRQFFSGMPKDLEEAAQIDGCNAFSTYIKIIVPLAKSAFVTVILFSFVWHWNDLYTSAAYFTQQTQPLMVKLNGLMTALQSGMSSSGSVRVYELRTYMQAGALLTITPPLVLYLFTQRLFTESIERTGIVG